MIRKRYCRAKKIYTTGRLSQPLIVLFLQWRWLSPCMRFFHCGKTKYFIKQIEVIFQKLLGKKFKLNAYRMIFGTKYKVGNYASHLAIFLWSKAIRVIWKTRRLLAEGKPCNEMALFKNYVNTRVETEYYAALDQPNRREKFLNHWCFKGVVATCNDAFEITYQLW